MGICFEKAIPQLNVISNYIFKSQKLNNEDITITNNITFIIKNQENFQSISTINQVENRESIIESYPYGVFIKDKLQHLNSKLQIEYSNILIITWNIQF